MLLLLAACQSAEKQSAPPAPPAASAPVAPSAAEEMEDGSAYSRADEISGEKAIPDALFSSAAARFNLADTTKKLIRSAALSFRVKSVSEATQSIENIVLKHGGFILKSNLSTQVLYQRSDAISRDSALETTRYSLQNDLSLRVPAQFLDTTLRLIGRYATFWNYRNISAVEVELKLLEEALERIRQGKYASQLDRQAGEAGSLGDKNEAATLALGSRAAADRSRLETLQTEDKIRYSTIDLHLYSAPQIQKAVIANTRIEARRQAFLPRLGAALFEGWIMVERILLAVLQYWSLVLLGVALLWIGKKTGRWLGGK